MTNSFSLSEAFNAIQYFFNRNNISYFRNRRKRYTPILILLATAMISRNEFLKNILGIKYQLTSARFVFQ